jgi:CRISPR/Cas system CSM-associated protein Csm3 (group 7 of RAMP superfamily)
MQKNVLLTPVGGSDIKGRLRASAEILIKVEAEDETLVNILDDIGLA